MGHNFESDDNKNNFLDIWKKKRNKYLEIKNNHELFSKNESIEKSNLIFQNFSEKRENIIKDIKRINRANQFRFKEKTYKNDWGGVRELLDLNEKNFSTINSLKK